jgi:ribosome maturation factor RimP
LQAETIWNHTRHSVVGVKVGSARFFFYCLRQGDELEDGLMSRGTEHIISTIENYAASVLEGMGRELVEVQFRREGHGWVLRLFIDGPDGVTIDDCAAVSRAISTWLDVEDLIEHAYHLEVSSPGLERPLKKASDYERFSGRKARIKLREPLNDQKVYRGTIEDVDEQGVTLLVEERPVSLAFDNIAKARLEL